MGAQYIAALPAERRNGDNHGFLRRWPRPNKTSGAPRMKTFVALACCCASTLSVPLLAADVTPAPATSRPALKSGIETQDIDPKVRAADDFYTHVNGKWLAVTTIPLDKP